MLPFDLLQMFGSPVARYSEMVAKMLLGKLPAPCTYYDLEIDDELLKQLEVVPSPKMTGGNRILLEMLLQRYGFESALRESALTGLL